jgi:hypothetical protein
LLVVVQNANLLKKIIEKKISISIIGLTLFSIGDNRGGRREK